MNLVRKIKISKITEVVFTDAEKEIMNYINSKLSKLTPFECDILPTSIFYMSPEGKWVLEIDNITDRLWVRYVDFWGILEAKFLIYHNDIPSLLHYMIECYFKQKFPTRVTNGIADYFEVEKLFKQQYIV